MGKFFKRLPANYRAAIDDAVHRFDGGEKPDIAEAYRESQAESLLESNVSAKDPPEEVNREDFGSQYCWFRDGWETALAQAKLL